MIPAWKSLGCYWKQWVRWRTAIGLLPAYCLAAHAQPAGIANIYFGVIEPPVVAQKDITTRVAISNQQLDESPLEVSSIAYADGQLLMISDRHQHALFTCPVDPDTPAIGTPTTHVVIGNENNLLDDAETLALLRQGNEKPHLYAMCSLSNDRSAQPLPQRRRMLRVELDSVEPFSPTSHTTIDLSPLRDHLQEHFEKLHVIPYRTWYDGYSGEDKNTYRWGNVEGMTFLPDGQGLLCGMRNPLFQEQAIMFVVRNVDAAFDLHDAVQLELADIFTLDLGGRGVGEISWDPVTKGYLIAAGKSNGPRLNPDQTFPPNDLDIALLWWSGHKDAKPVQFARCPDMLVDAVCRLGQTPFIALCSDGGDVSEGRTARQSVLTIMEFTGF